MGGQGRDSHWKALKTIVQQIVGQQVNNICEFQTESGEMMSCQNETIDCYVIDNNGFVVISEDYGNTGKFLGQIEGAIFENLDVNNVFKKIKIFDYQGICLEEAKNIYYDVSPASGILTPFKLITRLFNWILGQVALTIIRLEIHHLWDPDWTYALPYQEAEDPDYMYPDYSDSDQYEYDDDNVHDDQDVVEPAAVSDDDDYEAVVEEEILIDFNKTQPKHCDKESYLYELNESALDYNDMPLKGILMNCHVSNCKRLYLLFCYLLKLIYFPSIRPFILSKIPHTNLVLLVADSTCPCYSTSISVTPTKVDYGPKYEADHCKKLNKNVYRHKPRHTAITYHPQVNTHISRQGKIPDLFYYSKIQYCKPPTTGERGVRVNKVCFYP